MSLKGDAIKLSVALHSIVLDAKNYSYQNKHKGIAALANDIEKLTIQYDKAINIDKSKEQAKNVLTALAEPMNRLMGYSGRGEFDIFNNTDGAIENYGDLYTIFRELKYKNKDL